LNKEADETLLHLPHLALKYSVSSLVSYVRFKKNDSYKFKMY